MFVDQFLENIGRNDSDRILAFNIWLPLPSSETPYYEIFSIMLVIVIKLERRNSIYKYHCSIATGVCMHSRWRMFLLFWRIFMHAEYPHSRSVQNSATQYRNDLYREWSRNYKKPVGQSKIISKIFRGLLQQI